jgi:hypothetical protein
MKLMSPTLAILEARISAQKALLEQWRKPLEPLLFETLRAIDNVFCRELFTPEPLASSVQFYEHSLLGWGVNNALARMLPDQLGQQAPFKLFPSVPSKQLQADEFLGQAGILEKPNFCTAG